MWTEPTFSGHQGRFVQIPAGRVLVSKPVQKPHPPIWMACTSPSSYETAGRCAEIVGRYRDAGFDHDLALVQYGTLSHQETLESLRLFAEKVILRFA
jgi:alkanesulfonate monooxygenase SsuD/methylene tetrahydromethanopterin reductase-like flavin-dependent oxidoreductase (luciferase family)